MCYLQEGDMIRGLAHKCPGLLFALDKTHSASYAELR
jgi:hypothetical protein